MVLGRHYPRELFSINEAATRRNLEAYDRKCDAWYQKLDEMFPDYHGANVREQMKMREAVDEAMGYSL